jgi:hypothetical protein
MSLFNIIAGAALLLFGRRLFWVFVAGVGFIVGAMLATEWLHGTSDWITLLIALAVGIVGALLSIFLQKLIVGIAGFLAGGYIGSSLVMAMNQPSLIWLGFLLGAIVGAILILVLFDWALIALSALMGAAVIARNVPLDPTIAVLLFVVLAIFGIVVQARQLRRPAPAPPPEKPA